MPPNFSSTSEYDEPEDSEDLDEEEELKQAELGKKILGKAED